MEVEPWNSLSGKLLELRCSQNLMERHSTFCAMKSDRSMIHTMTHLIQLNMVHRQVKGLLLFCCTYLMWKKVEKLCSLLRCVIMFVHLHCLIVCHLACL
uniref:Uncharacterized protein n=1 Tax=Rhizophora mucronata TaxID=61149 RepID=A0A2P2QEM0_RHIMU